MIQPNVIVLNQAEYDNLIRLLDNPPQLSSRLVNAIKRLDSEGFNSTRKQPMKYKHIHPLLNRKPTNAGITAAFEINGDKVTFGLSVTSHAKTLSKLTVQQVMDKVT